MRSLTKNEQCLILTGLDRMRDRLLVLVGLYTGFRITEILSLRVADVWKNDEPGRAKRANAQSFPQTVGSRAPAARLTKPNRLERVLGEPLLASAHGALV